MYIILVPCIVVGIFISGLAQENRDKVHMYMYILIIRKLAHGRAKHVDRSFCGPGGHSYLCVCTSYHVHVLLYNTSLMPRIYIIYNTH